MARFFKLNSNGQALVEFVLILPIFLYLLLVIFDFGKIFNEKNKLENNSSDIIMSFKSGLDENQINDKYQDYSIQISNDLEYYKVSVKKSLNIITPGLGRIIGDPYEISVERYVPYEQ